jgi:hypothetical protein
MNKKLMTCVSYFVLASLASGLGGCGTLTGIPAHGGGKRFATEQRLVSASARAALMQLDVRPLQGKKAFLLYHVIGDAGGGTMAGGRANIGAILSAGMAINPVTRTANQFQVFDLAGSGTNYSNSGGTSNSVAIGTNVTTGGTTGISTTTGTNSGTNTSLTTSGPTTTTSGPTTTTFGPTTTTSGPTTTTYTPTTVSDTSTPGVTTTVTTSPGTPNVTTVQNSLPTTTSSVTNPGTVTTTPGTTVTTPGITTTNPGTTTTTPGAVNTTGTTIGTQTGTTTSSGTNTSKTTSDSTQNGASTNNQNGGNNSAYQQVSQSPSSSRTETKGAAHSAAASLQYRGLGDYQNFPIAVSDISYLNGLVQMYMKLSGIDTTQNVNEADTLVVVIVDIFGTIRSRFDAVIYNSEDLTAETAMEMFAFDKGGRLIMKPQSSNYEAKYGERYVLWAGPFETEKTVQPGKGQLVTFKDVRPGRAPTTRDPAMSNKEGFKVPGWRE